MYNFTSWLSQIIFNIVVVFKSYSGHKCSNIDNKYLKIIISNLSSANFFLPVNAEQVSRYSQGRQKIQPIVDVSRQEPQQNKKIGISEERKPMNSNVGPPPFSGSITGDDGTLYLFELDSTLPPNWKRYTNKNKINDNIYLSPDGRTQHEKPTANVDNIPFGWIKTTDKNGVPGYYNSELRQFQVERPTFGGSRSTKKTSIKKRILKKPKKTIRNTK